MAENSMVSSWEGIVFENGAFHTESRTIVREEIWHITVNHQEAGSFACSPVELEDAAVGYLLNNDWIVSASQVDRVAIHQESRKICVTVKASDEALAVSEQNCSISSGDVFRMISWLENRRERGVHSCVLVQGEDWIFRQDVSRSTAVDKAAGACLRQGIPTGNAILVFSGRVPEGIVRKCICMGCKIILACSGPTDLACAMAQEAGITIASLAGAGRFCIYTHPDRIA